jgi:hypothetical protein
MVRITRQRWLKYAADTNSRPYLEAGMAESGRYGADQMVRDALESWDSSQTEEENYQRLSAVVRDLAVRAQKVGTRRAQ